MRETSEFPCIFFSMTPALAHSFSALSGYYEGHKRWRRKEWGHLHLPQPSSLHLGGPLPISHSPLLAPFLGLLFCPLSAFPSPCPLSATHPQLSFLWPLPGYCLLYHICVRRLLETISACPVPFQFSLSGLSLFLLRPIPRISSLLPRQAQCREEQGN